MQFKGTLGIRRFRDMEGNKTFITKSVREEFERAFWHAIGTAVLDYGLHIPVLTGDTRKSIQEVLVEIDLRLSRVGGTAKYASALDVTTITESKFTEDDYPAPLNGVQPYKRPVAWPPEGNRGSVYYAYNRREWRTAVETRGHFPGGPTAANIHYAVIGGNQHSGKYTFYFSHGPDYWNIYDQIGLGDGIHGPWHLTKLFDKMVRELMDEIISKTADNLADGIVIVGTGIAVEVTPDYDLGKHGNFDLIEKGSTSGFGLGHLSPEYGGDGPIDSEVPF